ncbi:hypothetical protein GOV04_00500 [Candidatus Woesearchaeota archaeon]|nr:hypothetical protein [Candidatus Woesearchaeota archaeon]
MEKEIKDKIHKTGTTTLVIKCADGIVVGADMRRTLGGQIRAGKVEKIHYLTDNVITTWAGNVSDIQLLTKLIKAELRLKELRTNNQATMKEIANLVAGIVYQHIRTPAMWLAVTSFSVAGFDAKGYSAYEIGIDGSVSEIDTFDAGGSGMFFVMGSLEKEYHDSLTTEQGIKLAEKALQSSIGRDVASGDGYIIYTVKQDTIKKVFEKEYKETIVEKTK